LEGLSRFPPELRRGGVRLTEKKTLLDSVWGRGEKWYKRKGWLALVRQNNLAVCRRQELRCQIRIEAVIGRGRGGKAAERKIFSNKRRDIFARGFFCARGLTKQPPRALTVGSGSHQ